MHISISYIRIDMYCDVYVAIYGYNMSMYGCHAKVMVAN